MAKHRLAVFASGSGTNAVNIIKYFSSNDRIVVDRVISNKKDAPVLQKAADLKVASCFFSTKQIKEPSFLENLRGIDFIILAGFMVLIPPYLIQAYPDRILNIHPSLLPKYGGKGMYGSFVHQAVIDAGDKESGITIHKVNEVYDEGEVVFQASCHVDETDDAEALANRVHELEYANYPRVIEGFVLG